MSIETGTYSFGMDKAKLNQLITILAFTGHILETLSGRSLIKSLSGNIVRRMKYWLINLEFMENLEKALLLAFSKNILKSDLKFLVITSPSDTLITLIRLVCNFV